jgi:hypothetical protein
MRDDLREIPTFGGAQSLRSTIYPYAGCARSAHFARRSKLDSDPIAATSSFLEAAAGCVGVGDLIQGLLFGHEDRQKQAA